MAKGEVNDTEQLLDSLGELLTTLLEGPSGDADDGHSLIDEHLRSFFHAYYELRTRHQQQTLSVAVLALTKSGKSTLINALTGTEFLPMNNVPETARIVKILHDPNANEPILKETLPAGTASTHASLGSSSGSAFAATARGVASSSAEPTIRVHKGEAAVRARLAQLNADARAEHQGSDSAALQAVHSTDISLPHAHSSRLHRAPSSTSSARVMSPGSATSSESGFFPIGSPGTLTHGSLGSAPPPMLHGAGGGSSTARSAAEPPLEIHTRLCALDVYRGQAMGRLAILDTPGPNEAGEERLKAQVERLLDGVDAVLYLLDYTKLKTSDEAVLFGRLARINPALTRRLCSRLFFVVNKVDAMDACDGLGADETREYVAGLVTRQLGCAGFSLRPDQVLLISARNALLSRRVLSGHAAPDTLKRFIRLAFGAAAATGKPGTCPSPEALTSAANAMLDDSGILDLEYKIMNFLAVNAVNVKRLAMLDDVLRLVGEVGNVAASARACLGARAEEVKAAAEGMREEVDSTLSAFDAVMADADAVQVEVGGEIRTHLGALRARLFAHIVHTLDPDGPRSQAATAAAEASLSHVEYAPPGTAVRRGAANAHTTAGSAAAAAAGGSGGGGSSAAGSSRWRKLREKFLSIFTSSPTSGMGGPPAARSRSRDELAQLLADLHDDLLAQLHGEVGEFWRLLESLTASRHAALLSRLNAHLAALARRVEGAVSNRLQVELVPVDIGLRLPSAEQFHSDLRQLIAKGIAASDEKHIRVGQKREVERVLQFRGGLCRWGAHWVDVPRVRTVVETYSVTVFALQPNEIQNHFLGLVDGAISTSERALDEYVHAYVHGQLAAARARIQEYSERYMGTMSAALDTTARGATAQAHALTRMETWSSALTALRMRAVELQAAAELAVPQLADAEPFDCMDDEDEEEFMRLMSGQALPSGAEHGHASGPAPHTSEAVSHTSEADSFAADSAAPATHVDVEKQEQEDGEGLEEEEPMSSACSSRTSHSLHDAPHGHTNISEQHTDADAEEHAAADAMAAAVLQADLLQPLLPLADAATVPLTASAIMGAHALEDNAGLHGVVHAEDADSAYAVDKDHAMQQGASGSSSAPDLDEVPSEKEGTLSAAAAKLTDMPADASAASIGDTAAAAEDLMPPAGSGSTGGGRESADAQADEVVPVLAAVAPRAPSPSLAVSRRVEYPDLPYVYDDRSFMSAMSVGEAGMDSASPAAVDHYHEDIEAAAAGVDTEDEEHAHDSSKASSGGNTQAVKEPSGSVMSGGSGGGGGEGALDGMPRSGSSGGGSDEWTIVAEDEEEDTNVGQGKKQAAKAKA